ncbi:MAG: peptidoglycan-associated lipoprotein Pal [Gammaproteobacteria bacterium]
MLMKGLRPLVLGLTVCVGLAGCGSHHASKTGRGQGGPEMAGAGEGGTFASQDGYGQDAESLRAHRTYRFGFDRYDVADSDYPAIKFHAENLAKHPNSHIRIEGHTDERGSREYNIGLGERRARAVTDILLSSGASANQISVVSYGKEKPEVNGHSEDAYSMNRRAILVYEE